MLPFNEQLHSTNKPLVLDGAMGTELARRGVDTSQEEWSAAALETAPDVVRQVHIDYIRAGADIITTNTFRTHARSLQSSARAREWTHKAVRLAQEAVGERSVYIAGSVAPLEDCYSPHLTPPVSYCLREHRELIHNLEGVDLLLIETMNTVHEAAAAAQNAHAAGIPFVVSFVLGEKAHLLSGEPLSAAVDAVRLWEPSALMVNCIPTRHMLEALAQLREEADLPIGAYANMDTPQEVRGWAAETYIEPSDYRVYAEDWMRLGLAIVGSCCGSTPAHTAALRALADEFQPV